MFGCVAGELYGLALLSYIRLYPFIFIFLLSLFMKEDRTEELQRLHAIRGV